MSSRDTSVEAFKIIRENGLLSKRRMEVYKYLYENGPCTAKQVTGNLRQGLQDSGGYNTRLSELRRMGVVKEVDKVKCDESGQMVILWDVTSEIPKKLYKDPIQQRLADLGFENPILESYYPSDIWQTFRQGYYQRHAKVCFVSGLIADDLHHITYERLGEELDEDVVPLTKFWHEFVHHLVKNHRVPLEKAHLVARDCFKATTFFKQKYMNQ